MKQLNRREFLKLGAILAGGAAIAACAPAATPAPAAPAATAAPAAAAPKATDAPKAAAPAAGGKKKLEIFSWWTSGGEIEALNALLDPFKKKYPDVEVVNAAIAGGTSSGGDMKAVLQTRMMGGDPPESFQVHLGGELLGSYVAANTDGTAGRPLQGRGLGQGLPQVGSSTSPRRTASPTPCR